MGVLTDNPTLGWVALALVAGVVELATLDFVFLMLVGGALAAAIAAALGVNLAVQVVIAVVVALLLLGLVRPMVLRRMRKSDAILTGTAALVGREALVVETVTRTGGRIKLAGEVWSARVGPGSSPDAVLAGNDVRVLAIEGATAVVAPTSEPTDPDPTQKRLS